jgi:dephospho-CoA kinase
MTSILMVTGLPAAGKTTFARLIAAPLAAEIINLGDLVWRTLENAGLAPSSRREAGDLFVANFTAEKLGALALQVTDRYDPVILDGIRLRGTYEEIVRSGAPIRLVGVIAPWRERHRRLLARGEIAESTSSFDKQISELLERAQIIIDNSSDVRDLSIDFLQPKGRWFLDAILGRIRVPQRVIVPPWRGDLEFLTRKRPG